MQLAELERPYSPGMLDRMQWSRSQLPKHCFSLTAEEAEEAETVQERVSVESAELVDPVANVDVWRMALIGGTCPPLKLLQMVTHTGKYLVKVVTTEVEAVIWELYMH